MRGAGKPDGEVSNLLCDTVGVGDTLTLSPPFGDVVLDDGGRPLVLASGGIGVTPMAGMLSHLAAAGSHRRVVFLHADSSERSIALRAQVVGDLRRLPDATAYAWLEEPPPAVPGFDGVLSGTMNLDGVELPDGAAYFLCGPVPFMQAVRSQLLGRGVPAEDIDYEVFGPDLWQADLAAQPAASAAV